MQSVIHKFRQSTFLRHNAIFFIGSLSVGLLNYLLYPILGRLLHPTSFGEVQTLSSLFAQVAIFLSVLALITINIIANYEDVSKRNKVILELERLAVFIGVVLLLLTTVSSDALKSFFKFNSAWPFPVLALAVLITVPLTFRAAYLRGLKLFGLSSVCNIVSSVADIIFAVIFVVAGLGTTGAILGLVVGQYIAFVYSSLQVRKRGFSETIKSASLRLPDLKAIKPELKYSLLVFCGSLGITAMYSMDIIVVKHYFDSRTAGLYAGISTVARIIYFLTASITGVLLPAIKLRNRPRDNRSVMFKSFGLLLFIGGIALLAFSVEPRLIVTILMGKKYVPYAYLLPKLSLVMFVISVLNLFILYFIALRRYTVATVVILGLVITFGVLRVEHQSLMAVIDSLLIGGCFMLGLLGVWLGASKFIKADSKDNLRGSHKTSINNRTGIQ